MQKHSKLFSILVAALMVLTLVPMSAALADPQTGLPSSGTANLTLHKFAASAESETTGTGMVVDTSGLGQKLAGVGFTLYKVNDTDALIAAVKAGTFNPQATDLSAYYTDTAANKMKLDGTTGGTEQITDANGEIAWTNLPVGYYVLVETTTPSGGYNAAADSIITLPMGKYVDGQPTNDWNYDVHVYPKNVKENTGIRKEIVGDNREYNVGDTVKYTIETMTTKTGKLLYDASAAPNDTGSVEVIDILDPRLDLTDYKVILMGGTKGSHVLTKNTVFGTPDKDYDYSSAAGSGDNAGKTLHKWKLNDSWMEKIVEEKIKYVRIELTTTVNDEARKATTDGNVDAAITVENRAYAMVAWAGDTAPGEVKPDPGDPDPDFKLASVTVKKRHWEKTRTDGDPDTPPQVFINGAKFKIAASLADAKAGKFMKADGTFTTTEADHMVITTGGYDDANSNDAYDDGETVYGLAVFTGLPINASADTTYYLVETEAPAGYVKSQTAWEVTINNFKDGSDTDADISKLASIVIDNQHIDDPNGPMPEGNPTFKLPKTGGMGTIAFVVGGAVLLLMALVFFRKSRKDEEENATQQD